MLDGTNGAARLVFESSSGRCHAARLDRWIAIIRRSNPRPSGHGCDHLREIS